MWLKTLLLIFYFLIWAKFFLNPDANTYKSVRMLSDGKALSIVNYWETFQWRAFHQLILGAITPARLWLLDELDGAGATMAVR